MQQLSYEEIEQMAAYGIIALLSEYQHIIRQKLHLKHVYVRYIYDNDNILFNHNVQIEIMIYKSLENQIIN